MRINEIILTESQHLEEGPMLDKAGTLVGKTVGGVAKGVGAVAGGIAGIGRAFKKGYAGGKAVVGGDPNPNPETPPEPSGGSTPAPAPVTDPKATPTPAPVDPKAAPTPGPAPVDPKAAPTPGPAPVDPKAAPTPTPDPNAAPTAKDINAAGPDGSAPAKDQTGAAGAALAKTDAVTDKQTATKAGETVYAQVKANIDKLDKKGKQRILQLLTKSLAAPAPKPTAPKPAAPKPAATDPAAPADPGAAAFGNMAKSLTQEPAAAEPATPAAPTPDPAAKAQTLTPAQKAAQAATKARLQGTKAAGKSVAASTTGGFGKAVANAKAKGIATASKTNYGNALSEALAARVEQHRRDIFETDLRTGKTSIFKK